MQLTSIFANRHIFEGQANSQPLRVLLNFSDGRSLRLAVGGDGERLIADRLPLQEPFDMAEYGAVDIAEVTETLGPHLRGADVEDIRTLVWNDTLVGVQLVLGSRVAFSIWVDEDELFWGDELARLSHDWREGVAPAPAECLHI